MKPFKPKYITFDCYGTLTNFRMGPMARKIFADRIRPEQMAAVKCTEPPLLVVEVRSPSTALIDLNAKKAAYERFGVPSYWVVIPDAGKPELIVFELRDGHYAEAARVGGGEPFLARRLFTVEVVPARLVAGLQLPA